MLTIAEQKISSTDLSKIVRFVDDYSGIQLSDKKQSMVEGRLRKRLRHLNMANFKVYTQFVLSASGKDEVIHLIDALTTNKTNFFREKDHFDYIVKTLLPKLVSQGIGRTRPLRIWSAGCSSGEEPYTLAMLLSEWNETHAPLDFEIIATDISISVLKKAKQALYTEKDIEPVPIDMRRKYFRRSIQDPNVLQVSGVVKNQVSFGILNFKNKIYRLPDKMDIIFCRNVLIYFDKTNQQDIINKFCQLLVPQGNLFLGHSESIHGLKLPLDLIGQTIYQKHDRVQI
ncbi:CheR family methyltransferase [Colwellia piezophila]|uniref:CheR family methyltransferase n=1 Tax=Colwellia piezophila TaxID=211668 RepID=UPI00037C44A2|nr:protein-glutamate O-methyltransferase CheR [Colwellia piezophila]